MFTKKIDSSGNYLPFPGLTVVADVFSKTPDIFQHFHDRLAACSAITDYTALLPAESYHITAFSIIEQRSMGSLEWTSWLCEHLVTLQDLTRELHACTRPYSFRISEASGRRLTLLVEIDQIEAENEKEVAVKAKRSCGTRIPKVHHISLGYPFKRFENKEKEKLFAQEFHTIFLDVFSSNWQNVIYWADRPKLCFFNDMTCFIPWDAMDLPHFSNLINDMNRASSNPCESESVTQDEEESRPSNKLKIPFPPYSL